MATYIVPQDVEAEDTLIGYLTFKMFIYAIITVVLATLTVLSFINISPYFAILLAFPTLGFGFLAFFPPRNQPIETLLVAWLGFAIKPRKRIWSRDRMAEHVIIDAPVVEKSEKEQRRPGEVKSHLKDLAQLLDSQGWSTLGVNPEEAAAQQQEFDKNDLFDASNSRAMEIDSRIEQNVSQRREYAQSIVAPQATTGAVINPTNTHFDPYPEMKQAKIKPSASKRGYDEEKKQMKAGEQSTQKMDVPTPPKPKDKEAETRVANLAQNDSLSVSAIEHIAQSELDDSREVELNIKHDK